MDGSVGRPRVWWEGLKIGLETITSAPSLGAKRLILPVSYWRLAEFMYVCNQLNSTPGERVLDVGSPKDLAIILAKCRGSEVVATDILPEAVASSHDYATAQGIAGRGAGHVHSEVQDGRSLDFEDNYFAAAYSVSVLEHIPENGDSEAILELSRVVRPGGRIVITVPFSSKNSEEWVDRDVYERDRRGDQLVFYQRRYDRKTLYTRLIQPASARLVDLQTWGEGLVRVERTISRFDCVRTLLSPLEPLFSLFFLRGSEGLQDASKVQLTPMAIFITLEAYG